MMANKKKNKPNIKTSDILVSNDANTIGNTVKVVISEQELPKHQIIEETHLNTSNEGIKLKDEIIVSGTLYTNTSATTELRNTKNEKFKVLSIFNGKAKYGIGKDNKVIAWVKKENVNKY